MAAANDGLLKMASELRCPLCQLRSAPPRPHPARPEARPVHFNSVIHIDLKYQHDHKGTTFVALSIVDGATCFHQAKLLRTRDPEHVAQRFVSRWISVFGIPTTVVSDQGGEFETAFIATLEAHAIASKVCGSYAAWQNGVIERHNGLLGVAWGAAVEDSKAEGRQAMKVSLACAVQAKNATVSRRGMSAHALVFGRQAYLPELLDEEVWQAASMGQSLSTEGEITRQAEMRAAAKVALLRGDIHAKLKRALRRASAGGPARSYYPGEMIYFWAPSTKARYRKSSGNWRGRAVILVPDGAQRYFVSWRGRCLLVAASNLKPAALEDSANHDLRLREAEAHAERGYVDLTRDSGPPQGEEAVTKPEGPGLQVRRRRTGLGRNTVEARKMMAGLKSVKWSVQMPLQPRPKARRHVLRPVPVDQAQSPHGEPADSLQSPPGEPADSVQSPPEEPADSVQSPPGEPVAALPEQTDLPDSEWSDHVPGELDRRLQERSIAPRDPPDEETLRRRAGILDDLPWQFKKRPLEPAQIPVPEDQMAKRLRQSGLVNYAYTVLAAPQLHEEPAPHRANGWDVVRWSSSASSWICL